VFESFKPLWCGCEEWAKFVKEADDADDDDFIFGDLADFWKDVVEVFEL
jgi:hypothetical protein